MSWGYDPSVVSQQVQVWISRWRKSEHNTAGGQFNSLLNWHQSSLTAGMQQSAADLAIFHYMYFILQYCTRCSNHLGLARWRFANCLSVCLCVSCLPTWQNQKAAKIAPPYGNPLLWDKLSWWSLGRTKKLSLWQPKFGTMLKKDVMTGTTPDNLKVVHRWQPVDNSITTLWHPFVLCVVVGASFGLVRKDM